MYVRRFPKRLFPIKIPSFGRGCFIRRSGFESSLGSSGFWTPRLFVRIGWFSLRIPGSIKFGFLDILDSGFLFFRRIGSLLNQTYDACRKVQTVLRPTGLRHRQKRGKRGWLFALIPLIFNHLVDTRLPRADSTS